MCKYMWRFLFPHNPALKKFSGVLIYQPYYYTNGGWSISRVPVITEIHLKATDPEVSLSMMLNCYRPHMGSFVSSDTENSISSRGWGRLTVGLQEKKMLDWS